MRAKREDWAMFLQFWCGTEHAHNFLKANPKRGAVIDVPLPQPWRPFPWETKVGQWRKNAEGCLMMVVQIVAAQKAKTGKKISECAPSIWPNWR